MAKKGLGKGLSALIPESDDQNDKGIIELKITEVEPNENQPRRDFNQEALNSLAESIKEHGVVQPIIVRKADEGYQIVAGERRWRAARLAGVKTIPAVIKDYSDGQILEIALIENIQREDLNPIEEANAYKALMDEHDLSQDDIAKRLGKSRPAIGNSLRLLNLHDEIKDFLVEGKITAGHARALLGIEDNKKQIDMAKRIIEEGLNVRQVEKIASKKNVKNVPKEKSAEIIELEEKLRNFFGTKVNLVHSKKRGKIEIEYYSIDDLERILNLPGIYGALNISFERVVNIV